MLRWIAPQLTAMTPEDTQAIIGVALRTLERVPMTIDGTDEFFEHLRAFGCRIEGRKVHFTRPVVDQTMTRIAASKAASARKASDPPTEITWSTSGQALYVADTKDDRLRPCTRADLATYSQVIDAVDGLGRTHPGFIVQDAPLATRELHSFATIILHAKEPCRVSLYSPEVLPYYLRILEAVYGSSEEAAEHARRLNPCKVWINTPMMISRENVEAPMLLRKLTGQPLHFSSMPVAGIATPITPAGALALATTEVVVANAISLAVDDRLVGWIAGPLFFDMKTGIHTQVGPECILLAAGANLLIEALFGNATAQSLGGGVAAKKPGAQSVMERAAHWALNYANGARDFGALGTLAHSDIISTVQLMLDMEIVSFFRRAAKGFEIDTETLAEALIADVVPQGARFIDTEHTVAHFRDESWFPQLMDRRVPMAWIERPSDMVESARARALELEASAPNQCPLDAGQKAEIHAILKTADETLAVVR